MNSKIAKSVGDSTAHIAPLDTKQIVLHKKLSANGSIIRLFMEDDFSFRKKNQSIDYFFRRIIEYIRIKEYYVAEAFMFQRVTHCFPLNRQHLPLKCQHFPLNSQHLPVKSPTLAVETPTHAVETPRSNMRIEALPLNHQHLAVKSPTLIQFRRKVLVIQRENGCTGNQPTL